MPWRGCRTLLDDIGDLALFQRAAVCFVNAELPEPVLSGSTGNRQSVLLSRLWRRERRMGSAVSLHDLAQYTPRLTKQYALFKVGISNCTRRRCGPCVRGLRSRAELQPLQRLSLASTVPPTATSSHVWTWCIVATARAGQLLVRNRRCNPCPTRNPASCPRGRMPWPAPSRLAA